MELSNTLSLVQVILGAIQTLLQMNSVGSISDCKSQLDDLQNTVETVKAVLEDAEAKQESLNSQEKNYIQELKDAVYDADDVLDEFLTLAKQKQLRRNKVISFFFRFKLLTHRLSSKVKRVNDKLNKIATKSDKFSFKVDFKPMKFTKEETSSCLSDVIIGREDDVENIIGVLLGSVNEDHPNVSLLSIMGMGGLGKTALAQLVFNDPRITEAFPLKRWTCIADQDQEQLDLKEHLAKVVKGFSVTDKMSLEDIHHVVKQELEGQKYLLVLDDVWTENYDQWQKFKGFLNVGGRGSWIIVTTRSKTTAQMIGTDRVHVLQGLTEPESWDLFERMAFQGEERDEELVKLGKEIVKKCTTVPLAIRVVGSLLRGQSLSKWLSFHDKGLDRLSESNDAMMTRILKLSYDQLNPSLKTCFAYCAIFPKDWEISKEMLIQLWMAQGYINSVNLGEEYFLILLQRCFFQDIHKNEFGWWRRSESGSHMVNSNDSRSSREGQVEWESSPCFPLLKILSINWCENMMFVPLCPQLEELTIYDSRADMRCTPRPLSYPKLKTLKINNLEWLKSMPIEYTQFLSEINMSDERMERLGEVNEFPTSLLSSVRTLRISFCLELVSIRGWLEHLSALEVLHINNCRKVELGGMSWHNLAGSLQHLYLNGLKEMEELPEGMQYCTSLQELSIYKCPKLKYMPKWMPKLTSLQVLIIVRCSESLKERCQKPNGEDWPLIHHISRLDMW